MDGRCREIAVEDSYLGASVRSRRPVMKCRKHFVLTIKEPLGFWQSHPCLPLILAPSIGVRSAAHFI